MQVRWLPETDMDGIKVRPFRFTVAELKCGEVTTYGCVACPAGDGPFPALLHIHGGGQTCDREAVCEWVAEGYAAMSFDWTGGADHPERVLGEVMSLPEDYAAEIGVPNAPLQFFGHAAARCCLSILESLPEVDSEHIGIYGISWGGFLSWLVNGTDPRVKCAVSIYGTGGLFREGHIWDYSWQNLTRAERARWLSIMEPASYIHSQNSPMLHISGTNDFFGAVNVAAELLSALPDSRADFTPNSNHHFGSGSVELIKAFFNHYLRDGDAPPECPDLRIEDSSCDKVVVSTSVDPADDAKTELWFSYGHQPHHSRCWNRHNGAVCGDERMTFELNAGGPLWFYIRKHFSESGISISSVPACLNTFDSPHVACPVLFSGDSLKGLGTQWGTEIRHAGEVDQLYDLSKTGIGARSQDGSLNALLMRTPAAPESMLWPDKANLFIDVDDALSLTIVAWVRFRCRNEEAYSVKLASLAACALVFNPGDFKSEDGHCLDDFSIVESFELSGTSFPGKKLRVKYVGWVGGEHEYEHILSR